MVVRLQERILRHPDRSDLKKVKRLYRDSFPRNERYPFFVISGAAAGRNRSELFVIDEGDGFSGFIYSLPGNDTVYLFYIAVVPEKRGSGLGGRAIDEFLLKNDGKTVFLCADEPSDSAADNDIRLRRLSFYKRHGLHVSEFCLLELGVECRLLSTDPAFAPDGDVLMRLFKKVFSPLTAALLSAPKRKIYRKALYR